MRYLGAQYGKAEQIVQAYFNFTPKAMTFLKRGFIDPFSGTGMIAKHFSVHTDNVIAADYANFAYYLTYSINGYVEDMDKVNGVMELLNSDNVMNEKPASDFGSSFVYNYSVKIPYFTKENAIRIVNMRESIEAMKNDSSLNHAQYDILMGLLLERVLSKANIRLLFDGPVRVKEKLIRTPFKLKCINPPSECKIQVYNQDYNDTLSMHKGGVLYLNPPSLMKDYRHYYHLLDTLINMNAGKVIDKSGRLAGFKLANPVSDWGKISTARSAFYNVLLRNSADCILMTYNKKGVLPIDEIRAGFLRNGNENTFKMQDLGNEMLFFIERGNTWG